MDTLGAAPLLCPAPGAKSVLPPAYVRFSLYFVSCNTLYVPPAPDRGLTNVHSRASTESASAQRMRCTRPGRFLEGAT